MKNNTFFNGFFDKMHPEKKKDTVYQLDISSIRANLAQPRQDFNMDALVKLADSIRQYGVLQPLVVRKIDSTDGYRYELIAGERRLRASKMLGLKQVPCILSDVEDAVSAELALVENLLRENLNIFDQATAFASLAEKFGMTQEEIAKKMSLSQSAVANKIRLLKLTPEERKLITDAKLSERHARAFLRIPAKFSREEIIRHVIKQGLNVAATEQYIAELLKTEKLKEAKPKAPVQTATHQSVRLTSELVCNNIDRYVEKLRSVSDLVTVDRKVTEEKTIIILTVNREVG